MKILMVTMSMGIGGAETHILELSKALKKRGIDVEIASAGGVFVKELEKADIPHHEFSLDQRKISLMLKAEKRLKDLILKEKYDIVHAHARIPAFLCGRIRKSVAFHFITTDHLDFELTPLLKVLTNWGEHTFAVSEDLKKYLTDNFQLPPDQITLTVNGVDTERFSPEIDGNEMRKALNMKEKTMILHISRLDEPVSLCASVLMDAMVLLKENAVLVILGDGNYAEFLKEKAKKINAVLGDTGIILAGSAADVKPYLAASDLVVSPSRAVMEAMACAKPVIVAGSQGYGGIFSKEIEIDARKSNFCFRGFPLPTAEGLASDLKRLIHMPEEERKMLGLWNRKYIKEYYSVDRMAETQLAVYRTFENKEKKREMDILLCGYYGYGNLGDETLLSVMIQKFRKRSPNIRICVLSAKPKETAKQYDVDAVYRFDFFGIAEKMKKGNLFVFGGGSLLQDKTSNRSLSYYLRLLHMAKAHGMKICIFANGIGPILREKNREKVKKILPLADQLSFRDSASLAFCENCRFDTVPKLTFDPAVLLNPSDFCEKKNGFDPKKEQYFAVIPKKTIPKSDEIVKKAVLWMMKTYEMKPIVLSFFYEQDGEYAKKLAEEIHAEYLSFSDAYSCLQYMEKAAFVFSARLHGLIFATAVKVPMIAFSDDEKLFSYMETIGMGEKSSFSAVFSVKEEEEVLLRRLEALMRKKEDIQRHLEKNLSLWQRQAEESFDDVLKLLKS